MLSDQIEKSFFICYNRQSMTRIILENGFGNQPTQLWIGLIGHQANLTTIIDNNAWSTSDMTTLETPPTTGMTGIATLLLITSAKSHVERKLDKAFIRISFFQNFFHTFM